MVSNVRGVPNNRNCFCYLVPPGKGVRQATWVRRIYAQYAIFIAVCTVLPNCKLPLYVGRGLFPLPYRHIPRAGQEEGAWQSVLITIMNVGVLAKGAMVRAARGIGICHYFHSNGRRLNSYMAVGLSNVQRSEPLTHEARGSMIAGPASRKEGKGKGPIVPWIVEDIRLPSLF